MFHFKFIFENKNYKLTICDPRLKLLSNLEVNFSLFVALLQILRLRL